MFKYTIALAWRTIDQIKRTIDLFDIITLFSGVLVPLFLLFLDSGVWIRNVIFLACGLFLAIFTLLTSQNKNQKKEQKKVKRLTAAIRFVADLYAAFLLGYGIFSANKDPSVLSILPILPLALSMLWTIILFIVEKVVEVVCELFKDAVQMDFKLVIETWKKAEKFVHFLKQDGIEVNTEIDVSKKNQKILEKTLVKFNSEIATKTTELVFTVKRKGSELLTKAISSAKGIFHKKQSNEPERPTIVETLSTSELPQPIETPVAQIEAPTAKKKSPFGFLTEKKKKAIEQLPEASEEKTPEEALPKA